MDTKRVLIVDDDADTCVLLSTLLNKTGYDTQITQGGPDAQAWLEHNKPDLAVLDVMMPEMDGWEVYDKIRQRYDIPVIFLTALGGENATRALNLDTTDYMRKPYRTDELLARVAALINRPRLRQLNEATVTWGQLMNQRPMVSVILPTLNEAANLPLVLPYFPMNWVDEIILVDGLSTDGTVEIAKSLLPSIKVVMESTPGKGAALQAGYKAARGDIVIVLDCDGSHDPREIPRYVIALLEGADFVKGSRFAPGGGTTDMPRFRQLGNGAFVIMVNLFFTATFTDLCYGYHAFWKYCLDWIDLPGTHGFEIDTVLYIGAVRARLRITEVPSFEGYRFYGSGKLRPIPDGMRVLGSIVSEWWRSLRPSASKGYVGFRGKPPELALRSAPELPRAKLEGPR